jgi:hypothetical protein
MVVLAAGRLSPDALGKLWQLRREQPVIGYDAVVSGYARR